MTPPEARHTVRHTAPTLPEEAARAPEPHEAEAAPVLVTLVLRWPEGSLEARQRASAELARTLPGNRTYLTPDALVERFGPTAAVRAETHSRVRAFAAEHGLTVRSLDARAAVLEGAAPAVAEAFGVAFRKHDGPRGTARVHAEDATLPAELAGRVEHVLGLTDLPRSRRHHASGPGHGGAAAHGASAMSGGTAAATDGHAHTEPGELSEAYGFLPDGRRSGEGLRIGIVSLGGGFYQRDLMRYFDYHGVPRPGITTVLQPPATPAVQTVPVDGRWGDPAPLEAIQGAVDDPAGLAGLPAEELERLQWTVEVTMDVQLVGRLCPGAEIVVYFAGNDARGEHWALSEALFGRHGPPVISCSWGAPEPGKGSPDRCREVKILDALLMDAALLGRTVCVSSGDSGDGSTPGADPPDPHVVFPASSVHVLACGGSMFRSGGVEGSEVVWKEVVMTRPMASGGGFSRLFPRPDWQNAASGVAAQHGASGRGVPDVAAKADVKRGYCMLVGDRDIANGGTSAAAPFWAAMMALASKRIGCSPGFVNHLLYAHRGADPTHTIEDGDNGLYAAAPGWNPCCGLGSPMWSRLCRILEGDVSGAG